MKIRHIALLLAAAPLVHASSITLTQQFLDDYHVQGIVDFSQAYLGAGSDYQIQNTLGPGDTVYIQGHTREMLRLVNLTQGTAAQPITVTNTGGRLILQATSPSDSNGQGLGLWGCQHVIVKGTPGTGYSYGIKVASTGGSAVGVKITDNGNSSNLIGSLDIELTNLEIADTGFAGIQAKCESPMPSNYVMDNLRIHDNYIHDTGGEGMYIGWTSTGHHNLSNVEIQHNQVSNAGWDGIQVNFCLTNASVHDNTIIGYGIMAGDAPSQTGDEPYWQDKGIVIGFSQINIYNNWVQATTTGDPGSPIFLNTYATSNIYNNVLVYAGSSTDPNPEGGIYIGDASGYPPQSGTAINIMNNTIVTPEGPGLDAWSSYATMNFYNNIVAAPGHSQPYIDKNPSTVTVNELTNLYESTVAAVGFNNPGAGDYSLSSSSPAVDAGTNLSSYGVTTDFIGTSRPQGSAYDIGAYERVQTNATTILTPAAWGQAGSDWCPATGAFDAQPTWDTTTSSPVGDDPNPDVDTGTAYANRYWYVDFGPNYANLRITGMWTRYRPYSGGSYSGFAAVWWNSNNGTVPGTTATGMNFATAQNLPDVNYQQWVQDANFSSAPITPPYRYLVFSTGANPTNRANEFAFVGYTVP